LYTGSVGNATGTSHTVSQENSSMLHAFWQPSNHNPISAKNVGNVSCEKIVYAYWSLSNVPDGLLKRGTLW